MNSTLKPFARLGFVTMLTLLFAASMSNAQRPKNRIVIWDVTQSMIGVTRPNKPPDYGYNASHDIDKIVRKGIVDVINQGADDNSGSIRVMTFRHIVLDSFDVPNTIAGRDSAKRFVQGFTIHKGPQSAGNTNICGAWEVAMRFLDPAKQNIIYLFTDGEQNIPNGAYGVNCLPNLIQTYCTLTQNTDAFTFFVTLDLQAGPLTTLLKDACARKLAPISVTQLTSYTDFPKLINLRPMFDTLVINVQDQEPSCTERFEVLGGKLPDDFRVNAKIQFSQSLPLGIAYKLRNTEQTKCDIDFILEDVGGSAFNNLRNQLNGRIEGVLTLENATPSNSFISISPHAIPIYLFNKRPQTLNFIVK